MIERQVLSDRVRTVIRELPEILAGEAPGRSDVAASEWLARDPAHRETALAVAASVRNFRRAVTKFDDPHHDLRNAGLLPTVETVARHQNEQLARLMWQLIVHDLSEINGDSDSTLYPHGDTARWSAAPEVVLHEALGRLEVPPRLKPTRTQDLRITSSARAATARRGLRRARGLASACRQLLGSTLALAWIELIIDSCAGRRVPAARWLASAQASGIGPFAGHCWNAASLALAADHRVIDAIEAAHLAVRFSQDNGGAAFNGLHAALRADRPREASRLFAALDSALSLNPSQLPLIRAHFLKTAKHWLLIHARHPAIVGELMSLLGGEN